MRSTVEKGFTLIEVIVAAAIVGFLAIFLGATIQTSTYVNRDVWTHNEVADLATRLADEVQGYLVLGNDNPQNAPPVGVVGTVVGNSTNHPFLVTPRLADANTAAFVPTSDLDFETAGIQGAGTPAGLDYLRRPSITFRQRWGFDDVNGVPLEGAYLSPREQIQKGMVRVRWVPDPSPRRYGSALNPGELTEALINRDINGDGVITAGTTQRYLVGHMVVEFLNPDGTPSSRFEIGRRSPTRVLWNAPGGNAPNPPLFPIFGQPAVDVDLDGTTGPLGGPVDGSDIPPDWAAFHRHYPNQACSGGCGFTPAVQLNLTVLHDPVPSGSGAPEVAIFRLQRVVAFR